MTPLDTEAKETRSAGSLIFATLLRSFVAYLSLTPVIFCWGLLLIVLFVITLASFEAQTGDAIAAVSGVMSDLTARIPFLERLALDSPAVSEPGVIEINNENLSDVIFGLYGYVATPFVLLGILLDFLRGARPPRPLSKRIKILNLATLAVIAAFFVNFLLGSEIWTGSAWMWSTMFIIGPGIVWLVSLVSLTVHHFVSTLEVSEEASRET
jgi:hypothetical protein